MIILLKHFRQLDWYWWLLVLLAAAAVALRFAETSLFGVGISHDSANFIAVARSIGEFSGFISYDGRHVAFWPPLYPILIAVTGFLSNTDMPTAARLLNLLLYGIVIIQAGILFRQVCTSRLLAVFGCVSLIFAYPLTRIAIFAWSELLYLSLSLAVLTFIGKYRFNQSLRNLLIGALFAGFAVITRHIGAILILTFAVIIVFFIQSRLYRKLLHLVVLGSVSCSLWLGWTLRTTLHTDTIGGHRGRSDIGVIGNITQSIDAISNWLLPGWVIPLSIRAVVLIALCIFITLIPLIRMRENPAHARADKGYLLPIHGLYLLLYVSFMILVASTVAIDTLTDPRLYAPIVVSFWVLVLGAIDFYLPRMSSIVAISESKLNVIVCACFALWLGAYPVYFSLGKFEEHRQRGAGGYATTYWHNKHIVQYLQVSDNKFDQTGSPVYANYPDALYVLSGVKAKRSPRKYPYRSSTTQINDFPEFNQQIAQHDGVILIWITENYRKYLFAPDELKRNYTLQKLYEVADGVIYWVSKPRQGLFGS